MVTINVIGDPLHQWEQGRKLCISTWADISIDEVHFAKVGDAEAMVLIPHTENGEITVDIPNILLQTAGNIVAYAVHVSGDCKKTLRDWTTSVTARPKPSDYVYTETEVKTWEALDKRINKVETAIGDIGAILDEINGEVI